MSRAGRPLNLDEELIIRALYAVASEQVANGRAGLVDFEHVRLATATHLGARRPLGRDKARAILKALAARFSHDQGPPIAADRSTDEPLVARVVRRGQPVRYRLTTRGIAKARAIEDRLARARDRAARRQAADRQPVVDTESAAR